MKRALLLLLLAVVVPHVDPSTQALASKKDDYSRLASKEWSMVGGDWSNSRYSTLAQINTSNVERLGAAWRSEKFVEGGTSRATPVVTGGLLFVTAGRHVYALNARTGASVWTYSTVPDSGTHNFSPSTPEEARKLVNSPNGVPNGKGVGVGSGLVFVGLRDGRLIALEQSTGRLAWSQQTGIDEPKKGQWAAVAPTYIDGLVLTGLSDGDHNQRGRLTALDAATGEIVWQMFAVPAPGEPGHETWPSFNDVWKVGGGGVWSNPTVDQKLEIAYFTAGNPVPAYAGDWRPGANLYTNSVLAVDLKSGKLKWHYQLLRHDVSEADLGTPTILYDAQVGGRVRKALAVLRADGYLFHLDRETGVPLLAVEERPVPQLASQKTFPTQPFPASGESILMSCEDWKRERIPVGFVLGCMFTPAAWPPPSKDPQNVLAPFPTAKGGLMAYSPQTGYFYAQAVSRLHWPRRSQDPYFLNWVGTVPGAVAYGELAAFDSRTSKIAWRRRVPVGVRAGSPLATAGGLMFLSAADGNVEAYDARTGDTLWQFQTGGGQGGPAASYEVGGEQYIAASIGSTVWAFKLGGSHSTATSPAVSTEEEIAGPLVDTQEIETTALHRSLIEPGRRYFVDEYSFSPTRARVRTGAKVLFVNNGIMRHDIVGLDGSWGTGPLSATQEAWITFEKPGTYTYICREHPWSYGQIVVTSPDEISRDQGTLSGSDTPSAPGEQSLRGQNEFNKNCSTCHGEDLSGRGPAPALRGRAFIIRWGNGTVAELFDNIRLTMPQMSPGSLNRQTYLDILAYLIRTNDLPIKGRVIEDDDYESMKRMKIRAAE